MTRLIESLRNRTTKLILAAAVGTMLVPSIASAQPRPRGGFLPVPPPFLPVPPVPFVSGALPFLPGPRPDVRSDFRNGHGEVEIRIAARPVYEDRTERVWVEPAYRTVCDRVWRAPVMQDVCQRVWVESVFEDREVVRGGGWHRYVTHEQVLVSPGHWEDRHSQIVVAEGRWETIERQEVIAPGHWEDRTTRVHVENRPMLGFEFRGR